MADEKFKNPLDRISKDERHPIERRVLAAFELHKHHMKLVKEHVGPRPPFAIPLTPAEREQRKMGGVTDMQQRVQQMNSAIKDKGPQGAREYLDELRKLARSGEPM